MGGDNPVGVAVVADEEAVAHIPACRRKVQGMVKRRAGGHRTRRTGCSAAVAAVEEVVASVVAGAAVAAAGTIAVAGMVAAEAVAASAEAAEEPLGAAGIAAAVVAVVDE